MRRIILTAAFIGAFAFAFAAAAPAAPPASAGTTPPITVKAMQVSPAVVAAAATQPGAVVEGTSAMPPRSTTSIATTNPYVCYDTGYPPGGALFWFWSQWPTQQRLYEHRYWCGYLNQYQTYRVSNVLAGSDYVCSPGDPTYNYKTDGGNGYFYTDVLTSKHFQCTAFGSFQDYMVWRCNMAGYCHILAYGRL